MSIDMYGRIKSSRAKRPGRVPAGFRNVLALVILGLMAAFTPTAPAEAQASKPVFEVNGGDVVAGSSFELDAATPCGAAPYNDEAGIVGWNRNGSPDFAGSGGQYAAFAVSYIQEFATKRGSADPPSKLSFSNVNQSSPDSINHAAGMFGGMFGPRGCVDYWNAKPAWGTIPNLLVPPLNTVSLDGVASNTYKHDGNLTILPSRIQQGRRLTIYVNGNVAIQSHPSGDAITYHNTNWNNLNDIPSLRLIVRGVIHIDNTARELDGTYVAIPDADYANPAAENAYTNPAKGTISTCSDGFTVYNPEDAAGSGMVNACNRQLVVNGALIGNQIWLLRTPGSLGSGPAAEVINYTPDAWLMTPGSAVFDPSYRSVVGLPPVL